MRRFISGLILACIAMALWLLHWNRMAELAVFLSLAMFLFFYLQQLTILALQRELSSILEARPNKVLYLSELRHVLRQESGLTSYSDADIVISLRRLERSKKIVVDESGFGAKARIWAMLPKPVPAEAT